jgi:DNA-binding response OmpR family regulator
MAEVKFDDIRLFLCDPRVQVRSSLRMALNDAGMKNGNIWEGGDLEAITDSVSDPNGPDIVICDVTENTDDACQIFSAIRHNELGTNPFICIIGIAWSPKQALLNKVMGSGADGLVATPISPSLILDRIEALVDSRKPFVVTSDYIGPDRRFPDDCGNEIEVVEVPNSLRAKALGQFDAAQ